MDLRRVIGDGETTQTARSKDSTRATFSRSTARLVLLRTYDERSVVYHRQGRIGTYAIFWNHEAMQAGAVHALEPHDWIFPSYRESAIGLLRGIPPATVLSWWRGHPAGWWNPADHNVASICVPIATHVPHAAGLRVGLEAAGRGRGRDRLLRRRRHLGGLVPRGREPRRRDEARRSSCSATTTSGRSRRRSPPRPRAEALADKAAGYGMPAIRVDGTDVLAVYEATREAVGARALGRRADLRRGGHLPRGAARDRRRSERLHRSGRVEEARRTECLGRYEGYLRRRGLLDDELAEQVRAEALETMRDGDRAAEAEPRPTRRSSSSTPTSTRRRRSARPRRAAEDPRRVR